MEEKGLQFRTATFGGFQKRDVMDYLERSAREHAQKLAELQKELAEEKQARTEEGERAAALEQRVAALQAESQRLAADLAERVEQLDRAAAERDELRAQAAGLREELDRALPAAKAYEAVKDRTASIELEAHGRAQIIEREGREKAAKCQEQVTDWLAKTREAYQRLRADINATLGKAARELGRSAQELDQVSRSMEGLSTGMEDQDKALDDIQAQIESLGDPKMPEPLPLEPLAAEETGKE